MRLKELIPLIFMLSVGCQCPELVPFAQGVKSRVEAIEADYTLSINQKEAAGTYSPNPATNKLAADERRNNLKNLTEFVNKPLTE